MADDKVILRPLGGGGDYEWPPNSDGSVTRVSPARTPPMAHEDTAREIVDNWPPEALRRYVELGHEDYLRAAITSALQAAAAEARAAERDRCQRIARAVKWGSVEPTDAPYNRGMNSGAEAMREGIIEAIGRADILPYADWEASDDASG